MNTTENIVYKIAELKLLKPVNRDVINDERQAIIRSYKVQKATLYSDRFKIKSIITLQTSKGEEKIKSLILKSDKKHVILKGNIRIPIKSILDVKFDL
jgi:hypothetical protein